LLILFNRICRIPLRRLACKNSWHVIYQKCEELHAFRVSSAGSECECEELVGIEMWPDLQNYRKSGILNLICSGEIELRSVGS